MIKVSKKNKIIKILFLVYCIFLIYILFINKNYRNSLRMVNLEPFATLNRYIKALERGYINPEIAFLNIGANFILFVPMGFFMPTLFKTKIIFFSIINLIIISLVEIIQYITCTGSADIDDIILNFTGAIIAYILMQNKFIKKYINI